MGIVFEIFTAGEVVLEVAVAPFSKLVLRALSPVAVVVPEVVLTVIVVVRNSERENGVSVVKREQQQ